MEGGAAQLLASRYPHPRSQSALSPSVFGVSTGIARRNQSSEGARDLGRKTSGADGWMVVGGGAERLSQTPSPGKPDPRPKLQAGGKRGTARASPPLPETAPRSSLESRPQQRAPRARAMRKAGLAGSCHSRGDRQGGGVPLLTLGGVQLTCGSKSSPPPRREGPRSQEPRRAGLAHR